VAQRGNASDSGDHTERRGAAIERPIVGSRPSAEVDENPAGCEANDADTASVSGRTRDTSVGGFAIPTGIAAPGLSRIPRSGDYDLGGLAVFGLYRHRLREVSGFSMMTTCEPGYVL